jgi:hypothetical protein
MGSMEPPHDEPKETAKGHVRGLHEIDSKF